MNYWAFLNVIGLVGSCIFSFRSGNLYMAGVWCSYAVATSLLILVELKGIK